MNLSGKHIAILIDNYFEQSEFEVDVRLRALGYKKNLDSLDLLD